MSDKSNSNSAKVLGDYQVLLERFNFNAEQLLVHIKPIHVRRALALQMHQEGKSQRCIAMRLNVHSTTIRRYIASTEND